MVSDCATMTVRPNLIPGSDRNLRGTIQPDTGHGPRLMHRPGNRTGTNLFLGIFDRHAEIPRRRDQIRRVFGTAGSNRSFFKGLLSQGRIVHLRSNAEPPSGQTSLPHMLPARVSPRMPQQASPVPLPTQQRVVAASGPGRCSAAGTILRETFVGMPLPPSSNICTTVRERQPGSSKRIRPPEESVPLILEVLTLNCGGPQHSGVGVYIPTWQCAHTQEVVPHKIGVQLAEACTAGT